MEIALACRGFRGGLEPQDQAEVQGCPRDLSLSSPCPCQSLTFSSRPSVIPLCGKAILVPNVPPAARCVRASRPAEPPAWRPTSPGKREQEDGTRQGREQLLAGRDDGHGVGTGWTRGARYVPGNSPAASALPQESNRLRPVSRRFQTISQTQRPRE